MLRLPHLSNSCLKACFLFFSRLSDYAEEKTEKRNTEICGQKKEFEVFSGKPESTRRLWACGRTKGVRPPSTIFLKCGPLRFFSECGADLRHRLLTDRPAAFRARKVLPLVRKMPTCLSGFWIRGAMPAETDESRWPASAVQQHRSQSRPGCGVRPWPRGPGRWRAPYWRLRR